MSNPMATPVSAIPMFGGLLAVATGVVTVLVGNPRVGVAVIAAGAAAYYVGLWLHDWAHRRQGGQPHALWNAGRRGKGDQGRP